MWHEARKQEKLLNNMMIDIHKRSERKNKYFKSLNRDPLQLIRIYGKKCNRYISDLSSSALDSQFLVSWNEDPNVLIDRFDARANLDSSSIPQQPNSTKPLDQFQYICNYERYRSIILFESKSMSEEAYLQKLGKETVVKKKSGDKIPPSPYAAVGYQYKDSVVIPDTTVDEEDADGESSYAPPSIETNINLSTFPENQKSRLDELATHYGMIANSFCSTLFDERKQLERLTETKRDKIDKKSKGVSEYYNPDPALSNINYKLLSSNSSKYVSKKEESESTSSSESIDKATENKVEFITEFSSTVSTIQKSPPSEPAKIVCSYRRRSRLSKNDSSSGSENQSESDNDSDRNQINPKMEANSNTAEVILNESPISNPIKTTSLKKPLPEKSKSMNLREKLKQRTQDLLNNQLRQDKTEKKRKEAENKKAQEQKDKETARLQKKLNKY